MRAALLEDIGHGGDLTSDAILPIDLRAQGSIVSRAQGVVCGLDAARLAFELLDPSAEFHVLRTDGSSVDAGTAVARIRCSARALLTGERTALNLVCRLSGIATATRRLVDLAAGTHAQIVCTRKTTPGLRVLEKYAVRCGGGFNHRFGLDDAVLIKDNHIAIAGSIQSAVEAARARAGHMIKIEVEVDTPDQLLQALALPIDAVLLDNMDTETLRACVQTVAGRVVTEASGSISPERVAAVARTGVDLISSGWITHSAPAMDFGLDIA